ncbi:MAG: hypothetical protein GY947_08100 [Rhodobacteraceae bacterium]|nr:hypothetical protein [Paracoccaceae bacterium]
MPTLPQTDKDLRIIEDKVFRLESTLHGLNIGKKMKGKTQSVPTVMRQQWDAQLKKGVAAPSADFQITVGPNEKSGEESVVTYLDRRVEAEKPSAQAANICGQFMRDVDRSTVLIAGDDDNDDVQLTRANASDQLSTLCDDDKTVALNLSKFAQQGLFNALHGAVNMKMADQSAPIVMMDVHNDGGKKASDLSAQKMSISKSNDGVYKIDYKWKVNSGTVLGQDGAVYLNPDESGVSAHVSLTVNEEDLRAGNLKNYQLSNVTFNVKAVLDPYKTVVNQ